MNVREAEDGVTATRLNHVTGPVAVVMRLQAVRDDQCVPPGSRVAPASDRGCRVGGAAKYADSSNADRHY
jgi:hypothetical protein